MTTAAQIGRGTVALGILALGCRKEPEPAPPDASVAASVRIVSPARDDTVSLPVTIRLTATGVEVVPASGVREPGRGHHHLVIDVDVPPEAGALPAVPGVVHLGSGVSELVLDTLPAGPHRIIAVFAAGDHVPMPEVRQDTVHFVVR